MTREANKANSEGNKWTKRLQDGVYKVGLTVRAASLGKLAPFSSWAREERERVLDELDRLGREVEKKLETVGYGIATAGLRAKDIIEGRQAAGGMLPPTDFEVPEGDGKTGITQAQRNKWWDAMIGRKQERAKSIADLQEIVRMIEARIKITKDITRRMKLQDELWRTQQEIAAMAAQKREDRRETQMGWLEFAIERAEATRRRQR